VTTKLNIKTFIGFEFFGKILLLRNVFLVSFEVLVEEDEGDGRFVLKTVIKLCCRIYHVTLLTPYYSRGDVGLREVLSGVSKPCRNERHSASKLVRINIRQILG
jgi:hypothetical protein